MASDSAQYIFGEFSPDEFNQFFVTPRCTVELPPFNESTLCSSQPSDDLSDGDDDYQRIEFGVTEFINADISLLNNTDYSISSTLNPQAPEFILGCTPAQKNHDDDLLDENNYESIDCQFTEHALSLDSSSNPDEGIGSLGQRERKKKKKRPPGYYSYLEGATDGGPPEALVNGHVGLSGLNSISTEDLEFTSDVLASSVSPRTCNTPENSLDFNEALSDDASVSNALDNTRTAEQPDLDSVINSEQSYIPAESGRECIERTNVQPYAVIDTTENQDVTYGQTLECPEEGTTANGFESNTAESTCSELANQEETSVAEAAGAAPGSAYSNQPAKSWASLFHNSKSSASTTATYVETKYAPPVTTSHLVPEKQVEVKEGPVPVSEDPVAITIAELLENIQLIHKPVSLQPRGLINKGNWCYINATLQALVACPPMYHLMKSIPMYTKLQRPCTSTPMIDSFVRLMNEFTNMPIPPKPKQVPGDKIVKDIRPGVAFEPTYMYKLLMVIKSSLSEKNRQEDAEEYLGFILNGLHEEMVELKKFLCPQNENVSVSNGPDSQPGNEYLHLLDELGEGSEDEWEQVGPRNKSSVTRQADFVKTLITDIFGGHIRSVVYQQSSKESATLQPFFTLQLDIQSDKIRTVQDALESLVARESVQGYTTKAKQEVEISRRVTLEELPPVLVLHLKRFVYEKTGGCQKLIKNIEYPVDLEICKDLLSPGVKSKIVKTQRTYRLFAVVYHHGNSATGGHYTTDVFQIGLNGWLRIDDQSVKVINQYQVVKSSADRTAYLLYYRRVDLL
ncbi:ubiquitin carboxyl-terminal hydrolase 10 [Lissotriton helveticus]